MSAEPMNAESALQEAIDSIRPPEEPETPKPETPTEPAPPEPPAPGEPPPAPPPPAAAEPEDFSDERPWTPERVKNAAQAAKELTRKAHQLWARSEDRHAKIERKVSEFKRDRDLVMAQRDQLAADLRALTTGDPATVLQTLGRLTQRDATRVYTDLSLHLAGKKEQPNELEQLKAKLEAMEQEKVQERTRYEATAKIEHARSLIATGVRNTERWPTLAQLPDDQAASVAMQIENYVAEQYPEGRIDLDRVLRHDITAALNEAELYLRNHPELLQPGADKNSVATTSGVDPGPETRAQANPETARRPPGKSLTPSLASRTGGSSRRVSQAERLQELANDADFLPSLGIDI